ncbi:MAG: hypothetical protein IJN54_06180 [Lachnospiraceae bacterium]|nr:hypothetical protein [Lachnospiraceae bacterium]
MFLISISERMMFGSYHFPAEQMQEERSFFIEIVKSIEVRRNSREDKMRE